MFVAWSYLVELGHAVTALDDASTGLLEDVGHGHQFCSWRAERQGLGVDLLHIQHIHISTRDSKLSLMMRFVCCYTLLLLIVDSYPVGHRGQTGTRTFSRDTTRTLGRVSAFSGTQTWVVWVPVCPGTRTALQRCYGHKNCTTNGGHSSCGFTPTGELDMNTKITSTESWWNTPTHAVACLHFRAVI